MAKYFTYEAWKSHFKPIRNTISESAFAGENLMAFATYGPELEYVKQQNPNNVWTELDEETGSIIVSGYREPNRTNYFITSIPWDDESTEIPTRLQTNCDCTEDEEFDNEGYDPDCEYCEYGLVSIPCETAGDLRAIYGANAQIIA